MKTDISSKDLAGHAKAASHRAVERAKAQGISVVSQEGCQIIVSHADGTKDVLQTMPKAFVTPEKRRYKIS